MKMLMTGGPVFEYLDSVKIITNKFKGGRMAKLAESICDLGVEVYYLCSKDSVKPERVTSLIFHNGFDDYKEKVLSISPNVDAVLLGAAVSNLIPNSPWRNIKFPSHKYKEGDKVNIEFTVAPRIINMVKEVAPNTKLIGFKLLSNFDHKELVDVAYTSLLESRASFIIANDTKKLDDKFIVTKEKSEIPLQECDLPRFIVSSIKDEYYSTEFSEEKRTPCSSDFEHICNKYSQQLISGYDFSRNILFGCVALRNNNGFIVSSRGKRAMNETTDVVYVDHDNRKVKIRGNKKASLNAPLIDMVFKTVPKAVSVVHYHQTDNELITLPYAFPGTIRDSLRNIPGHSFNIEYHGTFLLLDKEGKAL